MSAISDLHGLQELHLTGDGSKPEALPDLTSLVNLTELSLIEIGGLDSGINADYLATLPASLTKLDLNSSCIADMNALSGLTNLTELNLSKCRDIYEWERDGNTFANSKELDDVSALSGLTNLTKLDLSLCGRIDMSPLSGLTNLTELNLSYCQAVDLSPLSGL
ncbi:MAG: leucine-rich repeat domain-containing protein, partial [Lachnospiraceae bacterium]|nr:leucine-rich repeat domain-containing protein [Lachnospiraceae bacterium]